MQAGKKTLQEKTIQIAMEKHQALCIYGSGGLIEKYNVSICMILMQDALI